MEQKLIAAIDVGTTKIVVIVGEKTENNKFNILQLAYEPSKGIEKGNVVNINDTVEAIRNVLNKLNPMGELLFDSVYLGIAGQHMITKFNSKELLIQSEQQHTITENDVKRMEEAAENTECDADNEIIGAIPISYIIDGTKTLKDPIDFICNKSLKANFLLIYAKKTKVNSLKQCIYNNNLKIKGLFIEPFAASEAVLLPEEKKSCVAMVDIGGGTSDLAVYENNKMIFSAIIPLGGNIITNVIKEQFGLFENHAEQIKKEVGLTYGDESRVFTNKTTGEKIPINDVAKIIKHKYEEIFAAILYQLISINYREKIKTLVITGGGALTKNLRQLANYCTTYDIRIAVPSDKIIGNFKTTLSDPIFSTAVGLIILGNKYEEKNQQTKQLDTQTIIENNSNDQNKNEDDKQEKKGLKKFLIDIFKDVIID